MKRGVAVNTLLLAVACVDIAPPPGRCKSDSECPGSSRCEESGVCVDRTSAAPAGQSDVAEKAADAASPRERASDEPAAPEGVERRPMQAAGDASAAAAGAQQDSSTPAESAEDAPLSLGLACSEGTQCESGQCLDGVCCSVASCEPCEKCGSRGKCVGLNIDDTLTHESCLPYGGACRAEEQDRCWGGVCTDGVCCATEACQTCWACNVEGSEGKCTFINGADAPDCQGSESCSLGNCLPVAAAATSWTDSYELGPGSRTDAWAQTFVVERSGELQQIRLHYLVRNDVDRVNVYLTEVGSDGLPATTMMMLTQQKAAHPPLPSATPDYTPFIPSAELRVTAGQKLAFVVDAPAATEPVLLQGGLDGYPEGTVYSRPDGAWKESIRSALLFQVIVAP